MAEEAEQSQLFAMTARAPRRHSRMGRTSSHEPGSRLVGVIVDVPALQQEYTYRLPPKLVDQVTVGSRVRVPLHGRVVAAWVTALDLEAPAEVEVAEVSKVSGPGPTSDVIDLARWAAHRWAGRIQHFLGAASPPNASAARISGQPRVADAASSAKRRVLPPRTIFRLAPAASRTELWELVGTCGDLLVVCPTLAMVSEVVTELRKRNLRVNRYPENWGGAASGGTVVGTRTAILATMPACGAIVVLDEHDDALQNPGSPTWNVREIAFERGRRLKIPVVLVSPTPTLEALQRAELRTTDRKTERQGWAKLQIVDRRDEDVARSGVFSEQLVAELRQPGRAVCVLNRKGRASLLACARCGTVTVCERCEAALRTGTDGLLTCPRCSLSRPRICGVCSSTTIKSLRLGVQQLAEQLERLLGERVAEVTATTADRSGGHARVVVGTSAALMGAARGGQRRVSRVAFLEFDQELTAPRYRASEQALALLAAASRLVGGRDGTVLVQTRLPDNEVLAAALGANPQSASEIEEQRRIQLSLPPAVAAVVIGGAAGEEFVRRCHAVGLPPRSTIDQHGAGNWLLRGPDRSALVELCNSIERPPGRLRLWVDPKNLE